MEGKETHHVSEFKKEKVHELSKDLRSKTVMILSIKGLSSAQFQDIKKKLRDKAKIKVAKKSLIDFALDHCGIKELHQLVPYVDESSALLFSDHDAFEISSILSENRSPAKAKSGDIALTNIEIKAGPTDLVPGPDISALSGVGLAPKVENGKISIMQDKVLVQEGKPISANVASILGKLDIAPFEVGITPVVAYMDGIIFKDIIIDKEKMLNTLLDMYSRVIPFSVEINYVNDKTLDFILGKAALHDLAIKGLISESSKVKEVVEEKADTLKGTSTLGGTSNLKGTSEEKKTETQEVNPKEEEPSEKLD